MGFLTRIGEALGLIKTEAEVLVVGLDNSGKTTLIHHLMGSNSAGSVDDVTPTVGYNMEHFVRGPIKFNVYDMSGHSR
jgi:ADP-ribosylation factor-like protein 6